MTELMAWAKKVPIALDGIQTCTSEICAHRASDYGTPYVSPNKHSRHSPNYIVKQKHALRNTPTPICGTRGGHGHQASLRLSVESEEVCKRKTKDRADGMSQKSAHSPRQDSNLHLWDMLCVCVRACVRARVCARVCGVCVCVCVLWQVGR